MSAVLLLCGLLCDDEVWEVQARALRGRHRVQVLHFGGCNAIGVMAQRVLDSAPASFALAGHSMGGRVALEVYRREPQRVLRLALLDTGIGPAAPEETELRGALVRKAQTEGIAAIAASWAPPMLAPARRGDAVLLARIVRMVCRMSPAIYAAQTQALLTRPDAYAVLAQIRCPTLVLCGRQDEWSPPERHARMAAGIAGARLHLVDDCGHMSTMERPLEVLAALETWLARPD